MLPEKVFTDKIIKNTFAPLKIQNTDNKKCLNIIQSIKNVLKIQF